MTRFERLRKEALAACRSRGHKMLLFRMGHSSQRNDRWATWKCTICDRAVSVITRPYPNEINIGGEAVALECGD